MKTIQIISQDVFDKIRSRFQNLEMGDETGAVTLDPAMARFFDFDFIYEGTTLGRVSISLANPGSLKLYYSRDLTEAHDDTSKEIWYSFLREMRQFSKSRLLRFDTRDIAKTNLDKEDFQHLAATQKPKEQDAMSQTMNESRWTRRTPRTSRVIKNEGTQVIVRYNTPMDDAHPARRSIKKYIDGIFVQNNQGERFKCPFNDLDLGLALGMHVDHGGVPHDDIGRKIIGIAEEVAQLQAFEQKVKRATLHDDALQIQEKAIGRLSELRHHLRSLSKRRNYKLWIESLADETAHNDVILDQITLEDYKAKFTQTSFIEGLEEFFPLIHKIMQEANTIDLENYVQVGVEENQLGTDESPINEFTKFEEWANELVEETIELSDEQKDKLKANLSDPNINNMLNDFTTAYEHFNSYGIVSQSLESRLDNADPNSELTPLDVFKNWVKEEAPELKDLLPAEEPIQPAQEPEAQELTPETTISSGRGTATVHGIMPAENTEMTMQPGTMAEDTKSKMLKQIAEIVKPHYNGSNFEVGPFRSEESVLMDVEQELGESARVMAEQFMEKLKEKWEHRRSKKEMEDIRRLSGLNK